MFYCCLAIIKIQLFIEKLLFLPHYFGVGNFSQQSFGNDFKQALTPSDYQEITKFSVSLNIESQKEGIKIAYFEVIISFSTYKTIITHHKNRNYPHKMQVSCIFASELKQRAL